MNESRKEKRTRKKVENGLATLLRIRAEKESTYVCTNLRKCVVIVCTCICPQEEGKLREGGGGILGWRLKGMELCSFSLSFA